MDDGDLTLKVGGQSLGGWTDIQVTLGVERCPNDFKLSLTEKYPSSGKEGPRSVLCRPGDSCTILLGGDVVVTGYIDRYNPSIDARQHMIAIVGRGKCQDLVDCSVEWQNMQVANCDVLAIAKKLAAPYKISVGATADVGPAVPQFNLMYGESPYEVIERVCRYRGLLAYELADGSLTLCNSGSSKMSSGVAEGQNVLAASAEFSMDQRFASYRGFALPTELYNDSDGGVFTQAGKPAKDVGVTRPRQRDIVVESISGYQDVVQKRINWEASYRQGRGFVLRVTVDSWRDSAGKLWTPNAIVPVDLPTLRAPSFPWTIGEVTFRRNTNDGTTAELVLMPKAAFDPEPTLPPDATFHDIIPVGPHL